MMQFQRILKSLENEFVVVIDDGGFSYTDRLYHLSSSRSWAVCAIEFTPEKIEKITVGSNLPIIILKRN